MSNFFSSEFIEEPDLIFGDQKEEKDPRIGLKYHGPYHYTGEKEPSPNKVRVGIIGNSTTITLAKKALKKLKCPIKSSSSNKWLAPDYPGFSKNTSIKCDFVTSANWETTIKELEIKKVLKIVDSINVRIAAGVNLFKDKVRILSLEDNKPDVIICAIPVSYTHLTLPTILLV